MKVSIITATYNSAATIADTVRSIRKQTHGNIEHIIIDGTSKDETLSIVRSLHNGIIISEKDKGIYDAMNKGIAIAKGDIIGILNSDDFYPSDSIIEKIVMLFNTTDCDAVYGDLLYVDGNNVEKVKRRWVSGSYNRNNFLYGWMPPHPAFFIRKKCYEQFGVFKLNLGSAADYELMLRMLYRHKIKASYLPEEIVHMRTGGVSNQTIKNRILANKNDRMAWKENGIRPYFFTLYLKPLRKIFQFIK
jgi:glycosyltransferase